MEQPKSYDAFSPNEQAPPLPSAALSVIGPNCVLQPPLSCRGTGPGLILLLTHYFTPAHGQEPPLDPGPVQKWAEEGFAVAGVVVDDVPPLYVTEAIENCIAALKSHPSVDDSEKFGLVIYSPAVANEFLNLEKSPIPASIAGVVAFTDTAPHQTNISIPIHIHSSPSEESSSLPITEKLPGNITASKYPGTKPHFVLPDAADYDAPSANMAHTRSLVFLRKHLGGPNFDIEAVWEEHTYWEFERRSVAQTMATMVAEPYVNHVPTASQTYHYNVNPPDTILLPISRTVGPDRVVDEFIFSCTHTSTIPWLLPSIPPTNKKLYIPFVAVVNVRGDRLYHEHIWWDQATALRQAGILPTHICPPDSTDMIRLPVAGDECARLLVDERDGESNAMIDPSWATQ